MEEVKKQLYIIHANNTRQLMQAANCLEITKEEVVSILSPTYKGDDFKLIYFR